MHASDAIRKVDSRYDSLRLSDHRRPHMNLPILNSPAVIRAIKNFASQLAAPHKDDINASINKITADWSNDHKSEFQNSNIFSLVIDNLENKIRQAESDNSKVIYTRID